MRSRRPDLLFTAPSDFLDPAVFDCDRFHVTREEVWEADDLSDHPDTVVWVTNPGQHFVVGDEILGRFPELQVVATPSTGTNHIDRRACAARGVEVVSLLDDRAALDAITASAEFAFLHVLNSLRRIDVGYDLVARGEWRDDEALVRGHELSGRSVGLVGLGRIGSKLARYFDAFGCEVGYFDPYVDGPDGPRRCGSLEELFSSSSIVVVCCTLNDATTALIGADLLGLLPRGSVVVNTSRGEIMRETELPGLLEDRPDLTYAADVVSGEVTGEHSSGPVVRLHHEGRALVTPHMAGATVESQQKAAMAIMQLVARKMEVSA